MANVGLEISNPTIVPISLHQPHIPRGFLPSIHPLIDGLKVHLLLQGPHAKLMFRELSREYFSDLSQLPGFARYRCKCTASDWSLNPDTLLPDLSHLSTLPSPDLGKPCKSGQHYPRDIYHFYRLPRSEGVPSVGMALIQVSNVFGKSIIPRNVYGCVYLNGNRLSQFLLPVDLPPSSFHIPPPSKHSNWFLLDPARARDLSVSRQLFEDQVYFLHHVLTYALEAFHEAVQPAWERVREATDIWEYPSHQHSQAPSPKMVLNTVELCQDELIHGDTAPLIQALQEAAGTFLTDIKQYENCPGFHGRYGRWRTVKVYVKADLADDAHLLRMEVVHRSDGMKAACREQGVPWPGTKSGVPLDAGPQTTVETVTALRDAVVRLQRQIESAIPYRYRAFPAPDTLHAFLRTLKLQQSSRKRARRIISRQWDGPVETSQLGKWKWGSLVKKLVNSGVMFRVGGVRGRTIHMVPAAFFRAVDAVDVTLSRRKDPGASATGALSAAKGLQRSGGPEGKR